jgi:hypothetical protein
MFFVSLLNWWIVLFYVLFLCKCVLYYFLTVGNPTAVKYIISYVSRWPKFRVRTSCHINKTIYKWVGCDCKYLYYFLHQWACFILKNCLEVCYCAQEHTLSYYFTELVKLWCSQSMIWQHCSTYFLAVCRVVVNLSVVRWETSFYILLWVLSEGGTILEVACVLFQSFFTYKWITK